MSTNETKAETEVCVFFNPSCSKCRGARDLLANKTESVRYVHYLDQAPSRAELESVMKKLGISSPREMMRTGESIYKELNLASASDDALLDAMTKHPILIERPIVIRGDRAVIARPPEKLLELFV